MAGINGYENPFLRGMMGARQQNEESALNELRATQGLLGINKAMQEQQLMPLKVRQLEQTLAAAKRKNDIISQIFGGQSVASGGENSPTRLIGNNPGASGGMAEILSDPQKIAALKVAGIDLVDMYKHLSTPQKREGGATYVDPLTGKREFMPKLGEGMSAESGGVAPVPGYVETIGQIGRAQEGAKAGFDMVQVPTPGGGTQMMTRADAARMLSGGQTPQVSPQSAPQQDPLTSQGFSPQQAQTLRMMDSPGAPSMSMSIPVSRPTGGIPTSNVIGGMGVTRPKLTDTLSPGQKAADIEFAKTYAEYVSGAGQGDELSNLTKIGDAAKELRSGRIKTGVAYAAQPDLALAVTNPELLNLRDNISGVVQRNLRAVLGPQFTAKEGEGIMQRAFDPSLPAGMNAYRLDMLEKQMNLALAAKQEAIKYYEQNGTLAGFKGKLYTVDDFRNMNFKPSPSKQFSLDDGTKVLGKFDDASGKYFVNRGGKKYFVEE